MRYSKRTTGFTLVEILTALAVVGVLLALLIPALSSVQKTAIAVKQKGQFHAIEVALETFHADQTNYPPSEYTASYGVAGGNPPRTCASQRLAEALVGRDGLGFHYQSEYRAKGLAYIDADTTLDPTVTTMPNNGIYNAVGGFTCSGGSVQTADQNLAARRGPYLELETANAVLLGNILGSGNTGDLDAWGYVLADMFGTTVNKNTGRKTGMPILYYRAHSDRINNDPTVGWDPALQTYWPTNTYDLNDSICSGWGIPSRPNVPYAGAVHPLANTANAAVFYNAIWNPDFTSPPRPYRANSFLLHSAGPDGLYGTMDDVFNFDASAK